MEQAVKRTIMAGFAWQIGIVYEVSVVETANCRVLSSFPKFEWCICSRGCLMAGYEI